MRLHRLLPLLFLAACSGDLSGPGPDSVHVDVTPVRSNTEWRAGFEVRNSSTRTIFLVDRCGEDVLPMLERRMNGGWVDVPYDGACSLALVLPVEVEPGERYEGSIRVREPGLYRLRIRVGSSPERLWEEVSREFSFPAD